MQAEIYHQNSQYFYPLDPFIKIHITMRHPIGNFCCQIQNFGNFMDNFVVKSSI